MKYPGILSLFFATIFFLSDAKAQEKKKLYFYADTITVSKENRLMEIQKHYEVFYIFYCKCLDRKNDIVFSYVVSKGSKPVKRRPKANYISWKQLLEIYDNNPKQFNKNYELYITELLPNRKYRQNKVEINFPREPLDDYGTILPNPAKQ